MVASSRAGKGGLRTQVAYKMLIQLGHQPDETGAIIVSKCTPDVYQMLQDFEFPQTDGDIKVEPRVYFSSREEKIEWQKHRSDELAVKRKPLAEEPVPTPIGLRRTQTEQQRYLEKLLSREKRTVSKVSTAPADEKAIPAKETTPPASKRPPFGGSRASTSLPIFRAEPPEPPESPEPSEPKNTEIPAVFTRLFPEPPKPQELLFPVSPADYNVPPWPGGCQNKVCRVVQDLATSRLSVARPPPPPPPDVCRIPTVRRNPAEQREYMTRLMGQDASNKDERGDTCGAENGLMLKDDEEPSGEEILGLLLPLDGRLSRISESTPVEIRKAKAKTKRMAGGPYRTKLLCMKVKKMEACGRRKQHGTRGGQSVAEGDAQQAESGTPPWCGSTTMAESKGGEPGFPDFPAMDEDELFSRIDAMIREEDEAMPVGVREGIEEVLWSALLVHRSTPYDLLPEVAEIPLRGMCRWMAPSLLTRLEKEMPTYFEALQGDLDESALPTLEQVTNARNALLRHAFEKPKEKRPGQELGKKKASVRKSSLSFWVD
eukprot:GEMP01022516.1.p1 GENE.GEMP01022516.1~~GEMP01022516.1.p1  ORF type:complete len:554 (+),score=156.02 GEMP01022516.1:32-1663(+)